MKDENQFKVVRGFEKLDDPHWHDKELEYLAIVDTQRDDEIFRATYAFKNMGLSKMHEEKLKIVCFILNTL